MDTIEIVLIFVSAVLALFLSYRWNAISVRGKVAMGFIALTSLVTAINNHYRFRKERLVERINAKSGEVTNSVDSKYPSLAMGNIDSTAVLKFAGTNPGLFSEGEPLIRLSQNNGKLLFNAVVYDLQGNLVAAIEDNVWTVFDDNYEYNDNNENAFELVTRGERNVFYQIETRKDVVYVSGYILNKKGFGCIIYNKPEEGTGGYMLLIANEHDKTNIPSDIHIPRLFKYPREKFYGQRI